MKISKKNNPESFDLMDKLIDKLISDVINSMEKFIDDYGVQEFKKITKNINFNASEEESRYFLNVNVMERLVIIGIKNYIDQNLDMPNLMNYLMSLSSDLTNKDDGVVH